MNNLQPKKLLEILLKAENAAEVWAVPAQTAAMTAVVYVVAIAEMVVIVATDAIAVAAVIVVIVEAVAIARFINREIRKILVVS